MPKYFRLNESGEKCISVGNLSVIPDGKGYFEYREGSPSVGQILVDGVWVNSVIESDVVLTRAEFILGLGKEVYSELKAAAVAGDVDAIWALMIERQTKEMREFSSVDPIVNEFLNALVVASGVPSFTEVERDAFFS